MIIGFLDADDSHHDTARAALTNAPGAPAVPDPQLAPPTSTTSEPTRPARERDVRARYGARGCAAAGAASTAIGSDR